ncbi:MAG: CRISPR-associated protein Cas2 [Spirochaetes bacterium]|nr:MAG: CRISPR-associated protein Cas2 [Spirochaetota bacterium]
MFVSVVCDIANEDHRKEVHTLLLRYGFKSIMKDVFESVRIGENTLLRLKRDIDRATDYYDKVRFYQYPLEDAFAISFLSEKKWRKTVVKP